eukprot:m.139080 g.139080  ORF g.139080 m.139080 type:complete len:1023 (-) comp16083_c2_seq19:115-3183(-)
MDETTVYRVDVQQLQLEDNLATSTNTAIFKGYALNDASENVTTPNYVAIKLLRSSVPSRFQTTPRRTVSDSVNKPSEDGAAPFQAELDCLLQLQHTHIVQTLGIVHTKHQDVGLLFELCAGGSIASLLQHNDTAVTHAHKLRWAIQAANALSYVHDQGWIHRDVAARNLLLSQDLTTCKLADFGAAAWIPEEAKVKHIVSSVVNIRYSSPEVLQLKRYSCRSDLYAFGLLLIELYLKGHKVYPGWDLVKLYTTVVVGVPYERPPNMLEELYVIARACMQPDAQLTMLDIHTALKWAGEAHRFHHSHCLSQRNVHAQDTYSLQHGLVRLCHTSSRVRSACLQALSTDPTVVDQRLPADTGSYTLSIDSASGEWRRSIEQTFLQHAQLAALAEYNALVSSDSERMKARDEVLSAKTESWAQSKHAWLHACEHLYSLLGHPKTIEAEAEQVLSPNSDIGTRVCVEGHGTGTILYLGLDDDVRVSVGVELDEANGDHNGTVDGQYYFECAMNHGILVPFDLIHKVPSRLDNHLDSGVEVESLSASSQEQILGFESNGSKAVRVEAAHKALELGKSYLQRIPLTVWDSNASTCQLPAWQRQALQPLSCSLNIVTFDASRLLDASTQLDEQSKLFPMLDTALLFNQAPILLWACNVTSPDAVADIEHQLHRYRQFDSLAGVTAHTASGRVVWTVSTDQEAMELRACLCGLMMANLVDSQLSASDLRALDGLQAVLAKANEPVLTAEALWARLTPEFVTGNVNPKRLSRLVAITGASLFLADPLSPDTGGVIVAPERLRSMLNVLAQGDINSLERLKLKGGAKAMVRNGELSVRILEHCFPMRTLTSDLRLTWTDVLDVLLHLQLAVAVEPGIVQVLPPLRGQSRSAPRALRKQSKRSTITTCFMPLTLGAREPVREPVLSTVHARACQLTALYVRERLGTARLEPGTLHYRALDRLICVKAGGVQMQLALDQGLIRLSSRDPGLAVDWLAFVDPRLGLAGVTLAMVQEDTAGAGFGFGRQLGHLELAV